MKKLLFVYNPKSGKGQIKFHLSAILEVFAAAGYDITVYPTKSVLDGCQAVQERAGEFDRIICSGGDGTLDEVVTGLMHSGYRRTIGYIPAGSTNDFAVSIGISRHMEQAAREAVSDEIFACDIGRFNDDYFVYVAAFGVFTSVSYQTDQELKNVLGHAAYIVEGVKQVGSWKSYSMKIESEEFSDEGKFIYGMISNSNSVAGIKGLPGKNIELNDGYFEVMLVREPQNLTDFPEIVAALLTQDEASRNVVRFKTKKLTITSEEPVAWTRDGENGGQHTTVELENLQEVLEIAVPGQHTSAEDTAAAEPETVSESEDELPEPGILGDSEIISEAEFAELLSIEQPEEVEQA